MEYHVGALDTWLRLRSSKLVLAARLLTSVQVHAPSQVSWIRRDPNWTDRMLADDEVSVEVLDRLSSSIYVVQWIAVFVFITQVGLAIFGAASEWRVALLLPALVGLILAPRSGLFIEVDSRVLTSRIAGRWWWREDLDQISKVELRRVPGRPGQRVVIEVGGVRRRVAFQNMTAGWTNTDRSEEVADKIRAAISRPQAH